MGRSRERKNLTTCTCAGSSWSDFGCRRPTTSGDGEGRNFAHIEHCFVTGCLAYFSATVDYVMNR